MKSMKKGLAVLLTALLLIPNIMSVSAKGSDTQEPVIAVESRQSTGESTSSDESYEEQTVEEPAYTEENKADEEQSEPEEDSEEEVADDQQDDSGEDSSDLEKDETDEEQSKEESETDEDELKEDEEELESAEKTDAVSISGNALFRIEKPEVAEVTEEVLLNTGDHVQRIVNSDAYADGEGTGDGCFEEDGSYTIEIPEINPFFPYEVQFTYQGEVSNRWFMTPSDSVEVGGHTFYVEAEFDGTAVTQMSLNVAGDKVIVYPEEKEFTDNGGIATVSLLPLKEDSFSVDLTGYTPVELTMVSVSTIFGDRVADDTYDVVWKYSGDDYTISSSGDKLDLSMYTYSGGTNWEMIVGVADQLAADNTRYNVNVRTTRSQKWLIPTVYTQDGDNVRTDITALDHDNNYNDVSKDSRRMYIYGPSSILNVERQAYVSLAINNDVFGSPKFSTVKAYKGRFETVEAVTGKDITGQIFSKNMTEADEGYLLTRYNNQWITMVTYDVDGNVTGCLPFYLYLTTFSDSSSGSGVGTTDVYLNRLYEKSDYGSFTGVTSSNPYTTNNGSKDYTYKLYGGYPANGNYYLTMTYQKQGVSSPSDVTGAFVGNYSSIGEAEAAGASNIKDSLFKSIYDDDGGYAADYSQRVYFTIFVGEDGTDGQEVYHCSLETEVTLRTGAEIYYFYGLNDSAGKSIPSYNVGYYHGNDSYADNNYFTMIVNDDVDLTNVAPVFSASPGAKVYVGGSTEPEISGETTHDFTKGPVQYSVSSEDGNNSKNYWLQIVQPTEEMLYINSLGDESSKTKEVDGVIYSTREVMLDSYHGNKHDILLANMGKELIEKLSVELDSEASETLVLDDYWTLTGDNDLLGFDGIERETSYGELFNLAMIRLLAKDSAESGAEVSGTLTIKSGDKALIVLTLTGTIGDPCITTKDIPEAVKYVPYGTMIQNNNKYNWNKVTYSLVSGSLPEGMVVQPNGELYGVPKETGEFSFTVCMTNSSTYFSNSEKDYILTVLDNTDENVENANDDSYGVKEYVEDITMTSAGEQTLVAEGEFGEFQYLYLDGERLTRDVDFTAESGSTRITISNQTLAVSAGTHTLGIEFRTTDEELLKRAAQNYEVSDTQSSNNGSSNGNSGNDSGSSSSGSGTDSSSGSSGSGSSSGTGSSNTASTGGTASGSNNASTGSGVVSTGNTGSSNATISTANGTAEVVEYTVEAGDTLWKIAQKYYGSGTYWTKLYADNADTISNPDKIYVGQKIKIYPIQSTATTAGAEGTYYTVVSGDNLYKIAQKFYGKGRQWKKIYNANEDIIAKPERIYVGQVIFIPEE